MKMKKLLAAALAVLMLLTMLPVGVFAVSVDYVIEFDDEGYISVNGTLLEIEPAEGEYGYKTNWEFGEYGILDLYEGTFEVISAVPLNAVYTGDNVTIVNGVFAANHFGNAGIIGNGMIDADITNIGTINGGAFSGEIENSGTINGGTFTGYVENVGTITGGTFFSQNAIRGEGTVNEEAVKYLDEDDSIEWYPLHKVTLNYEGEWADYRVLLSVKWEDNHNEKNTRPNHLSLFAVDGAKNSARYTLIQDIEDENDLYDLMLHNGYSFEDTWHYDVEYLLPCSLDDVMSEGNADAYFTFVAPEGYTASVSGNTITMKLKEEPKTTPAPVIDVEENEEDEGERVIVRVKFDGVDEDEVDFVNVQLLKNGKAYKKAVKVDEKDEWRHEWNNLNDSSKIEWSVAVNPIEGYNMDIEHVRGNYWTITLSKDTVEKANPETGTDSFVGTAVALTVCSVVCGAVLSFKK